MPPWRGRRPAARDRPGLGLRRRAEQTGFSTYVNDPLLRLRRRSEFRPTMSPTTRRWRCGCSTHRRWRHRLLQLRRTGRARRPGGHHRDVDRLRRALDGTDSATAFMARSAGQIAFNYPDQRYGSPSAIWRRWTMPWRTSTTRSRCRVRPPDRFAGHGDAATAARWARASVIGTPIFRWPSRR